MRHSISLTTISAELRHVEIETSERIYDISEKYCPCWIRCGFDIENEIMRMAEFEYAAIVAECDWQSIIQGPPRRSKLFQRQSLPVLSPGSKGSDSLLGLSKSCILEKYLSHT
jgi:hypothetical protein